MSNASLVFWHCDWYFAKDGSVVITNPPDRSKKLKLGKLETVNTASKQKGPDGKTYQALIVKGDGKGHSYILDPWAAKVKLRSCHKEVKDKLAGFQRDEVTLKDIGSNQHTHHHYSVFMHSQRTA